MSEQFKMTWEKITEEKFKKMLSKMPIFHRHMTEVAATQKAEENAKARESRIVEECDLMEAMFSEVPLQFYSLMIRLLDDVGFDYKKYNLPRPKGALSDRRESRAKPRGEVEGHQNGARV